MRAGCCTSTWHLKVQAQNVFQVSGFTFTLWSTFLHISLFMTVSGVNAFWSIGEYLVAVRPLWSSAFCENQQQLMCNM